MPITVELTPPDPAEEFSRADLEFRGVDHSGPSFEARIFFNNPRANPATAPEVSEGYAGSFHIFGHGGCFGELGHCDITEDERGLYDYRPPHPLTPYFKTVIVTEALRALLRTGTEATFTATVVAVVPDNPASPVTVEDPLKFESVSLIAYQDPAAGGIPLPESPN
jgi:hypothetical protein